LLFSAGSPADQEMVVADLAGGKRRRLGPGAYPLYHPAGFVIYQATPSEGGLWALPFSADRLEPTGKAFPVALQGAEPSLADDGSLVYVDSIERLGRQQLVWRDRAGARLGPIGLPQARIRDPALSPDGRFVAVEGSEEGNTDVWIHDAVEGTKSRLSYDPAIESNPIWHPSGRTVTYRFDRSGNAEIFERAADRSEAARALLATPAAEIPNSWTPDGRKLVYSVIDPATQYDIWMRGESAEEQIPLLVTRFNETAAQVSPDGRYLAYVSDESGQYEVYVREFPRVTRQWQVSTQGGAQPRWSHNGRELFYVDEGALIAVEILEDALEFKTGARARLFENPTLAFRNPLRRSYDVSGDGSRFVMYELVEGPPSRAGGLIRVVESWDPTDSLSPER
jgi:dipeptidyl aminopeptidase/acylaminoacyl peptidase